MSDDLKTILYGKTVKVVLADGKEYIMREPSLDTLIESDVNMSDMSNVKNIRKMTYLMIKGDNPNVTEEGVGRLITFSMLKDGSSFMKAFVSTMGVDPDSKN